MKRITNWRNATVFDIEANGLLKEADKLHVLSYIMEEYKDSIPGDEAARWRDFFRYHMNNGIPVIAHNGICYDIPLVEKILGIDLTNLMVIDTLALSWYLNVFRKKHGLDSFFEDYGIKKPEITDWEGLTYEEYAHRCEEDCEINLALWDDLRQRLIEIYTMSKRYMDAGAVGGKRVPGETMYIDSMINKYEVDDYVDWCLTFLMFKMDNVRLKEKTGWLLDEESAIELLDELETEIDKAKSGLEAVMPPVPDYRKRKKPKKPTKDDGTLSVSGKKWLEVQKLLKEDVKDEWGNPMAILLEDGDAKVICDYKPPNANSDVQVKKFLFSHGWEPETFEYKKDKEAMQIWADSGFRKELKPVPRKIPQINKEIDGVKELCPSVGKLADKVPEVMNLARYGLLGHRKGIVAGFLKNMDENGRIPASTKGFTNTLREAHTIIANLPGVDKLYGERIRGLLIAEPGNICLGSDLSSLEDRTKHHFMIPYDPEYVKTMMSSDYDPHILMAFQAKLVTEDEMEFFKEYKREGYSMRLGPLSDEAQAKKYKELGVPRHSGKQTNYSAVYGGSADAVALAAGVSKQLAKKLVEAYWELNWAVKKIAEDQKVFTHTYTVPATGDKVSVNWLINPINGLCYECRGDKDRFSTLNQGTGSFLFDMWVDGILTKMEIEFGVKRLNLLYHDEYAVTFFDSGETRAVMERITHESLEEVNDKFLLRRKMGCDVAFGSSYSEIH